MRLRSLLLVVLLALALPASGAPRPGFGWPLFGTPAVERGFLAPTSVWGAGHRGVDLRGRVGEPVLAAGTGQITFAGLLAGRGVVAVTHPDGLRTTYEPVTATVVVGQTVTRGAVLGRLATGHPSCRAGVVCLHWGLRRGDAYLDPLLLVGRSDVRLLPLGGLGRPAALPPVPILDPRAGRPPPTGRPATTLAGNARAGGSPVGTPEAALGVLAVLAALTLVRARGPRAGRAVSPSR